MPLRDLLAAENIDPQAVAAALDGMTQAQQVAATRALPPKVFPRLYAAVGDKGRLSPDDLVPADYPANRVVRHIGVNSLPAFRCFEKPMYRSAQGGIAGRNVQSLSWLTGPGYFTVRAGEAHGEVAFAYAALPTSKPDGWPAIRSNALGFSFFVYRNLLDVMRRVSRDVIIGEAWRGQKNLGQYFILVRERL